jgi:glycosyltransferase involved in cell wall biosynthesis
MKIACITAGAGRMYCGSCLRDNALAAALLDAGQDVLLIPTYTPTRTDETNVSMKRIFLGGINVYLQQHFSFFRKSPQLLDRMWDFRPLLRFVTRLAVSVDPADLGSLAVSMLRGNKGFLKKEVDKLVHFLAEIEPDIVILPNSLLISLAPAIKEELKVPVCCTLQGEDLFLEGLEDRYRKEAIQIIRQHAARVDAFIAVSNYGAESMAGYLGIDRSRIHVIPLGISFEGFEQRNEAEVEPFTIGYLARIAPEKGLHFLCEAYKTLRSRENLPASRLWAAGYLAPEHKSFLAGIRKNLESWGLSSHFQYQGELDRIGKINFLKDVSVFSVPEIYNDPKGLFLLEAMAAGIPVVQPRRGAFSEMIELTGGGILVEADNPEALAQGLYELWNDPDRRNALGSRGYQGVREHYSVAQMAEKAMAIYRSLVSGQ